MGLGPQSNIIAVHIEVKIWIQTHTGRERTTCENEGRDWGDAFTSQGMPKITGKAQNAKQEEWNKLSFKALEEADSADTLISNFQPLDL